MLFSDAALRAVFDPAVPVPLLQPDLRDIDREALRPYLLLRWWYAIEAGSQPGAAASW